MGNNVNRVCLTGHVWQTTPELQQTAKGEAYLRFRLAVKTGYRLGERTDFFEVVLWKGQAEAAAGVIVKGCDVEVEGRLRTRDFRARDNGQIVQECTIWAYKWEVKSGG